MIIDAHTHLGRPGGALEARAVDLIASMDKGAIDKAMVFAGRLNSITTEQVIDEIADHPRLYAVASVSVGDGGGEQAALDRLYALEEYLKHGVVRGLKFYPGYEPFYPADEWLRPFLALLAKYNRPAIFHSGDTFSKAGGARLKYALPIHIDDLAVDMPELKIIIAHLGYPWVREAAEIVYKNKNVYSDCSGGVYGDFTQESEVDFRITWNEFRRVAGGTEKVLFGTDWPISGQRSYRTLVESFHGATEAVFSGNAVKLFGL